MINSLSLSIVLALTSKRGFKLGKAAALSVEL